MALRLGLDLENLETGDDEPIDWDAFAASLSEAFRPPPADPWAEFDSLPREAKEAAWYGADHPERLTVRRVRGPRAKRSFYD